MNERAILETLAAMNTQTAGDAIRNLTDFQWRTLAGLVAHWLDDPESGKVLTAKVRRRGVSKAKMIATIICLIASGHLKLEVTFPEGLLSTDEITDTAEFDYRIYVPDEVPEGPPGSAGSVGELIWSKLDVFADAVKQVRKMKGVL
jgi:hypothetical protein